MLDKQEIIKKLQMLIEEITFERVKVDEIKPSHNIIKELKLDSIDYAGVLLACEEWLSIKIKEDNVNWAKIQTVDDLAQFLYHEGQKSVN